MRAHFLALQNETLEARVRQPRPEARQGGSPTRKSNEDVLDHSDCVSGTLHVDRCHRCYLRHASDDPTGCRWGVHTAYTIPDERVCDASCHGSTSAVDTRIPSTDKYAVLAKKDAKVSEQLLSQDARHISRPARLPSEPFPGQSGRDHRRAKCKPRRLQRHCKQRS